MTEPQWAQRQRRNSDIPRAGTDALLSVWNAEQRTLPMTAADAAAKAREYYLFASTIYTAAIKGRAGRRRRRDAYEQASLMMSSAQWMLMEEARLRATERSTR